MKQKEPHPHDQLFKQALGRKDVMLDFLANRLPKEVFSQIHQESLQLTNKTFAGKVRLRGESDVIFKATINNQPGYVYFLIEHQSAIDYWMPLRFLEYNVRLMRQHISEDGHKKLPVILNICMYNGQKAYDGPTNLLDMCANPDWVRRYMFQSFQLVDLNRETDMQLLKDNKAAFAEMLLQQGIHRDFYTRSESRFRI
ncbi:MAG TPA: Rpn family recombination-promoting nuclease/putative transposase [Amoebophilaceae bacterium]|jgi:predicted transposase/invertase (TIGR01784 family)|nr:Rpn family recombination-promoting nuclease/putative transposase [Amoebophilaceae bacterium]